MAVTSEKFITCNSKIQFSKFPKIQSKYSHKPTKMQPKYYQNTNKIQVTYNQSTLKIQLKYNQNSTKIQPEYNQNTTKIHPEYNQNTFKIQPCIPSSYIFQVPILYKLISLLKLFSSNSEGSSQIKSLELLN